MRASGLKDQINKQNQQALQRKEKKGIFVHFGGCVSKILGVHDTI